MGRTFAASLLRYSLRPAQLLATLADRTGYFSQANGGFSFQAFDGSVALPAAGYHYGGNSASSTGGSFARWNSSQHRCTYSFNV